METYLLWSLWRKNYVAPYFVGSLVPDYLVYFFGIHSLARQLYAIVQETLGDKQWYVASGEFTEMFVIIYSFPSLEDLDVGAYRPAEVSDLQDIYR